MKEHDDHTDGLESDLGAAAVTEVPETEESLPEAQQDALDRIRSLQLQAKVTPPARINSLPEQ